MRPAADISALGEEVYTLPEQFGDDYLTIHPDTLAELTADRRDELMQQAIPPIPPIPFLRLAGLRFVADESVPRNLWRLVSAEDKHTRRTGRVFTDDRPSHLWPCGCLINDGDAHRVGCPEYPQGRRGDRWPMAETQPLKADTDPAYCGFCDHHAKRHNYAGAYLLGVPCVDCPERICRRTPKR